MSLEAIGLVSENPEESVRFYKILGVDIKRFENTDHYEGVTPSGLKILLDSEKLIQSFEPSFKKVRGTGMTLCFKQNHSATVDSIYKQMTEAGFKGIKAPWDAFWGQRYACVSDPDGYQIDLFAPL
jgi:uncharacterized glyoxalase superfamily protein PhnB